MVSDEIKLQNDECCIVFDFGCYFPFSDFEILTFGFSLGMDELNDYKLNHRYPNKGFGTISKKNGRKLSKIGYPYIFKLNEQTPKLLCLKVGLENKYITLIFPVQTYMSKEKPVCGLSLRYNFDKSEFCFKSYEEIKKGIWCLHSWSNYEAEGNRTSDNDIMLSPPSLVGESSNILIYEDVIEPCPSTLFNCKI